MYLALFLLLRKHQLHAANPLQGFLMVLLLLLMGYHYTLFFIAYDKPHFLENTGTIEYFTATARENTESKTSSIKTVVEITAIKRSGRWEAADGKVLLYQSRKTNTLDLRYGDRLLLKGNPRTIPTPANPAEFDYKKYLADQKIYLQHFVYAPEAIRHIGTENSLWRKGWQLRARFKMIIQENLQDKKATDIALALVLGVKEGLNTEIKGAYAAAGAMHILAVSGLHVGIVYGIIVLLFSKLTLYKAGKIILVLLSLSFLWMYAFITGFSPSVVRAVTMFSLFIVAKSIARQTNIYNTLALAAFLLLCYNPLWLFSVGFQLSFLAVMGIVYLQPKIYHTLYFENKLADALWALTAVSIAAQVATFPLGLYYFHQFPIYFAVANLVVIPAAYIILILGFLLLFTSFNSIIASFIGQILDFIISTLNSFVFRMEMIPGNIIDNIYLSSFQTMLLFLAILCLIALFHLKRLHYGIIFLMLFLVGMSSQARRVYAVKHQRKIVFYAINNASATDFIAGDKSVMILDSLIGADHSKYAFHIEPSRLQMGLKKDTEDNQIQGFAAIEKRRYIGVVFEGKKILFIKNGVELKHDRPIDVDYLIISDDAVKDLSVLNQKFTFKMLIIDSSNKNYVAEKLRYEADSLNLAFHSIPHSGSLTIDIIAKKLK